MPLWTLLYLHINNFDMLYFQFKVISNFSCDPFLTNKLHLTIILIFKYVMIFQISSIINPWFNCIAIILLEAAILTTILWMISVLLILLGLPLWPSTYCILVNFSCTLEKVMYYVAIIYVSHVCVLIFAFGFEWFFFIVVY